MENSSYTVIGAVRPVKDFIELENWLDRHCNGWLYDTCDDSLEAQRQIKEYWQAQRTGLRRRKGSDARIGCVYWLKDKNQAMLFKLTWI